MIVDWRLSKVTLMKNPEHVVAVQHAPERAKRIAEAKVDPSHLPEGGRAFLPDVGLESLNHGFWKRVDGAECLEIRVDQSFESLETAFVLLPNPGLSHGEFFHGDELRANPRTIFPSDAHSLPGVAAMLPFIVKKAALAERCAQTSQPPRQPLSV